MNKPLDIIAQIKERAQNIYKQQVAWRHYLHQHPEISNQEFNTTKYLKEQIKKLGLEVLPISQPTGLIADLAGINKYPIVAIRTDIDALPIPEQTQLPYKSQNPGCMHACGHDMHMATVLGTAVLLDHFKKELNGSVRFIFQPAEEMPPGGARPMIADGVLEGVDCILGLHVDPEIGTGKIGLRDGPTMASVTDFNLIIQGQGGHAARPHDTVDAIVIASDVISGLQKIISRNVNPIEPAVITFGQIEGGVARNVICDRVILTGTARTLSAEITRKIPILIKRTAEGICRAHGAKVEMEMIASYPVLSNHSQTNTLLRKNYSDLFGKNKIQEIEPVLGGEDFACYLEITKGAMFRLGIQNKKIKADKPWHSPHFIADDDALFYGTSLLTAAVVDYLRK